ncbi:MAG: hypothetical protein HY840_13205, partial [Bacteroidetes bacterium]|nr:hypothetical protein [Bacteroidota bacterium]
MKHKTLYYLIGVLLFSLNAKAQWIGGSQDGYAMVKNTDCAAYPAYPNMFLGGSEDGYAMVKNTDCAAYPPYPNIFIGGTCSGESSVARTCSTLWVVPSCRLPFGPLPIELLSFSAKWLDKQYTTVILQWATTSETNNDYFVIERSIDAIDFKPIAQINGAGNSNIVINYYAFDKEPYKTSISYYRLKQVDFDGKYTHSHIEVILPIDGIDLISIFPNPAHDKFEYEIGSIEKMTLQVRVMNMLGQITINATENIDKGISNHTL